MAGRRRAAGHADGWLTAYGGTVGRLCGRREAGGEHPEEVLRYEVAEIGGRRIRDLTVPREIDRHLREGVEATLWVHRPPLFGRSFAVAVRLRDGSVVNLCWMLCASWAGLGVVGWAGLLMLLGFPGWSVVRRAVDPAPLPGWAGVVALVAAGVVGLVMLAVAPLAFYAPYALYRSVRACRGVLRGPSPDAVAPGRGPEDDAQVRTGYGGRTKYRAARRGRDTG